MAIFFTKVGVKGILLHAMIIIHYLVLTVAWWYVTGSKGTYSCLFRSGLLELYVGRAVREWRFFCSLVSCSATILGTFYFMIRRGASVFTPSLW